MMWVEQLSHTDLLTRILDFGTLSTGAQLFSWKGDLRQRGKSSGSCIFPANFTSVFTHAHIHPSRVFNTELPSTANIKISEEASDTCWAVRTGQSHSNKWERQLGPGHRWAGDTDTRTTHFQGKAATKKCWMQSILQSLSGCSEGLKGARVQSKSVWVPLRQLPLQIPSAACLYLHVLESAASLLWGEFAEAAVLWVRSRWRMGSSLCHILVSVVPTSGVL